MIKFEVNYLVHVNFFVVLLQFELIYFQGIWLDHHNQYRWFQVVYQVNI